MFRSMMSSISSRREPYSSDLASLSAASRYSSTTASSVDSSCLMLPSAARSASETISRYLGLPFFLARTPSLRSMRIFSIGVTILATSGRASTDAAASANRRLARACAFSPLPEPSLSPSVFHMDSADSVNLLPSSRWNVTRVSLASLASASVAILAMSASVAIVSFCSCSLTCSTSYRSSAACAPPSLYACRMRVSSPCSWLICWLRSSPLRALCWSMRSLMSAAMRLTSVSGLPPVSATYWDIFTGRTRAPPGELRRSAAPAMVDSRRRRRMPPSLLIWPAKARYGRMALASANW